jgi:hypothetical protein
LQQGNINILVERAWQSQPLYRSHRPGLPHLLAVTGANRIVVLNYPISPPLVAHGEVWVILEVSLGLYQEALLFLPSDYRFPLVCLTTQQHIFKHSSNRERSVF